MTRHLTRADYIEMPWANGRGTTIELLKATGPNDTLLWRFSMATVSEAGAFSMFPQIERNLTVIDGPGFDLVGAIRLRADPLQPVAFAGDEPVSAVDVASPSVDFNVMTHRSLRKPVVKVLTNISASAEPGALLCIFALDKLHYGETALAKHDLLFDAPQSSAIAGNALAIQLFL